MEKIELFIAGLSYSQSQTNAYALILGEKTGKRRLPIIIGGFEAQAIAIEMEKITPTRPLTHDLFKTFSDHFHIIVKEVVIYNLIEGIFYAQLVCDDGLKTVQIDARTSDAIAIATRFNCPIYTYESILQSAGIIMEDNQEQIKGVGRSTSNQISEFESYNEDELTELLTQAVEAEDYERASKLRDELNKRKK
jgi:bifunctional DNase/RNase